LSLDIAQLVIYSPEKFVFISTFKFASN
jgi:hypothetical protein